ncbi:MAG: U32 family peptidase [Verrucomicrobia bacterium]|nr:U32 family peptidase [Verrucomicrobiota bacterium]
MSTRAEFTHHSAPEVLPRRLPELLAPAGDWDCAKAAVENGADAIYFGLARFNARMRARNFTDADLPELMQFLHRRGVKGYVTFNTLVFADELADAEHRLRTLISAGVDAAIVQDAGICRLIREISPDFPIHASTQMTITSAAGIQFAKELGCSLVVLARECSIKDIERIVATAEPPAPEFLQNASTPHARRSTLPLEVFVHGALCVAYSGQCLTSEALGGRSANRGECAQACRMPYELISDGRRVPLGDRRYLLSPQDLAGLEVLPDLIRAGVASLKIEGRLKSPEYVANITRVYRRTLDRLFDEYDRQTSPGYTITREVEGVMNCAVRESRYDLEMAFSRGLSTGWLRGTNNQELVHARFGKKRGAYLGEVVRLRSDAVAVRLAGALRPGDGVVFDAGHPEEEEEGGRVFRLENKGAETWIEFANGQLDFARLHIGDRVWKTSDPELHRKIRGTFAGDKPHFRRLLRLEVRGSVGRPLTMIARDEAGHLAQLQSRVPLVRADNQPLNLERLREQLGRLGGTPFQLGDLENRLEGLVMLPLSELNRLRREMVAHLEAVRARPVRWTMNSPGARSAPADLSAATTSQSCPQATFPELVVLVRSLEQLEVVLGCGIETLYCEFEDPKKYRTAVQRFRDWQGQRTHGVSNPYSEISILKSQIFVAPPRIFKMGEDWILQQVRSCGADGYLVRNYDHLEVFRDARRIGDFSLNIANPLSAEYFVRRFGLERVTASYDLNFRQLEALLRSAPPQWFEITIHQHMPLFHMEHCVFCAFLSKGTDYRNCGRPCDTHEVKLRDRVGAEHPLKADAGCRNTLFNAIAQTGAECVSRLVNLGVRRFRIEFLNETAEQVARTVEKYTLLLRGEITGAELWRELKLFNQLGVTRGQM